MLEHLFGSKARIKLLALFLKEPESSFFVRELTRKLNLQINSIRRELSNLEEIKVIKTDEKIKNKPDNGLEKKYYHLNKDFVLYSELQSIFLKNQLLLQENLLNQLNELGKIEYLALLGIFCGERLPFGTDMLIIGRINRQKLFSLIKNFETDLGQEINYTVMTPEEFSYRKDVTDKFLYQILENNKKIVLVDKANN